jgi:hypothetical protein
MKSDCDEIFRFHAHVHPICFRKFSWKNIRGLLRNYSRKKDVDFVHSDTYCHINHGKSSGYSDETSLSSMRKCWKASRHPGIVPNSCLNRLCTRTISKDLKSGGAAIRESFRGKTGHEEQQSKVCTDTHEFAEAQVHSEHYEVNRRVWRLRGSAGMVQLEKGTFLAKNGEFYVQITSSATARRNCAKFFSDKLDMKT